MALAIGVLVGASLASAAWVLAGADDYPSIRSVPGEVSIISGSGNEFGFVPDEGTPIGYDVFATKGTDLLVAGNRVTLKILDLSVNEHIVLEIKDDGPT